MASDSSTIRLRAGATAVLVFLAYVIDYGLFLISGIELPAQALERGAVEIVLPVIAANTTLFTIFMWGIVIWAVLTAIFGIDLYRILADDRSALLFAPVALIGGAVLFIIQALLMIGIIQGLAPAYAGATGAEQSAIGGTTRGLLRFRTRMALVGGVLWSLAAISFGREMLRSGEFPGWLGYGGYAVGVVGVVGAFFPLFVSLIVVRTLGQVLLLLWILIAGIILLRYR